MDPFKKESVHLDVGRLLFTFDEYSRYQDGSCKGMGEVVCNGVRSTYLMW